MNENVLNESTVPDDKGKKNENVQNKSTVPNEVSVNNKVELHIEVHEIKKKIKKNSI